MTLESSSFLESSQKYKLNWRLVHCDEFHDQVHQNQWRIQDFPEEGVLTPKGGRQPIIWPIFPENCMKMKKFWARGARVPRAPP